MFDDGGGADGGVYDSTQEFAVQVVPVNEAPVFRLAASTVLVNEDSCGDMQAVTTDRLEVAGCGAGGARQHNVGAFAQAISLGRFEDGLEECDEKPVSECEDQVGNFTVEAVDDAIAAGVFSERPAISWPDGALTFALQVRETNRLLMKGS